MSLFSKKYSFKDKKPLKPLPNRDSNISLFPEYGDENVGYTKGFLQNSLDIDDDVFVFDTVDKHYILPTPLSDECTFVCVIDSTGTGASYSNVFNFAATIQLRHSATDWYFYVFSGASWRLAQWVGGYSGGRQVLVCVQSDGAAKLYADNQMVASIALTGGRDIETNSSLSFGIDINASIVPVSGTGFVGTIESFQVLDYAADELLSKELTYSPYVILKSKKSYFILTSSVSLLINKNISSKTSDNIVLTQQHNLAISDNQITIYSDNIDLLQANVLFINKDSLSKSSDDIVFTQSNNLSIDESLRSKSSDNQALTQSNIITINDDLKSKTSDNITVNTGIQVEINDILFNKTSDDLLLVQQHVLGVVRNIHSSLSDNIDLSQANIIVIVSSTKTKTDDNIVLSTANQLVVDGNTSNLFSDNIILLQDHLFDIDSSIKSSSTDNINLQTASTLIVDDNLHQLISDNITLLPDIGVLRFKGKRVFVMSKGCNININGRDNDVHNISVNRNIYISTK